jgi:hypothetical protein
MFNALAIIIGIALISFLISVLDRLSRHKDRERRSTDTAA